MVRVLVIAAAVAAATPAAAGTFGGFSKDRATYLDGNDQVCTPLPAGTAEALPACRRGAAAAIAGATYRTGKKQSGARGMRAEARGSTLRVFAPGDDVPAVVWNAGGVVSRVAAVYATDDGALVAVEYETRKFGRTSTESVVFRIGGAGAAPGADQRVAEPGTGATSGPPARPRRSAAELAAARKRALGMYGKRRWKGAIKAARGYLAMGEDSLEVRYALAVALARTRDYAGALAELEAIAGSKSPKKVIWLVDARTDKAFARLRKQPRFRAAVGLDKRPGTERHAYERLLDGKGVWEQPMVKCDQARVVLTLRRQRREFTLKIQSSCKGYTDTVRLGGTWEAEGTSVLLLTFPNDGGKDELTRCQINGCGDDSGEDCVRCALDADLAMTLRPVRR